MGLGDRLGHRPSDMSGGQQQRVAVARALVGHPTVVFADEPTGNLNSASSADILGLLRQAVDEFGQTTLTGDPRPAGGGDRRPSAVPADGEIVHDVAGLDASGVLATMNELGAR